MRDVFCADNLVRGERVLNAALIQKLHQIAIDFVCVKQMIQPFFGTINRLIEQVQAPPY